MSDAKTRAEFMSASQQSKAASAGNPPRSHQNMMTLFGVARPGKTAKDRAGKN